MEINELRFYNFGNRGMWVWGCCSDGSVKATFGKPKLDYLGFFHLNKKILKFCLVHFAGSTKLKSKL